LIEAEQWIADAERAGTTLSGALEQFDTLPPPDLPDLVGRWRGVPIDSGHMLDGMLAAFGWYGKQFVDAETVFPLLFGQDRPVALNPRLLPLNPLTARLQRLPPVRGLFRLGYRALATGRSTARLRVVDCRGVPTLSMIYDRQPIIDHFRQVSPDCMLGLMDCRGFEPLFFALHRAPATGPEHPAPG
jgi:hypothetical protein